MRLRLLLPGSTSLLLALDTRVGAKLMRHVLLVANDAWLV